MADVNLNQALVTGSTAGVVFSAFMLAMRLMFAREKHEYTRLENRIMLLEKAHDDCLKNEAELKSQLGGLKATLALLSPRPIARVSANADGKITEWSNSATNLFGWSRSEAIGSSVNILIPSWIQPSHESAFQKAIARGNLDISIVRETTALHKNGTEIPVTIILSTWKHGEEMFFSAEVRER